MKNKVLIAFTNVGVMTASQLPNILKRAGYHTTMMGKTRRRLSVSWNYDAWINASDDPREIITRIADMLRQNPDIYDWIILSDDLLLRALIDLGLPVKIATRISTVRDPEAFAVTGSKTETAACLEKNGILVPAFRICTKASEIPAAAAAVGFPLMVKLDRGQNATGVFKCANADDVTRYADKFIGDSFQIEKFIEGDQVGVEPLYMNGELVAFISANVIATDVATGLETRRHSIDDPNLIPILRRLGAIMQLHGFCNLGFVKSRQDGKLYLFEADFRPNAWIVLDKFYNVDFAKALRGYLENPSTQQNLQIPQAGHDIRIFYREIEQYLREGNWQGLWGWVRNADACWRFIPMNDPSFVARTILRLVAARLVRLVKSKLSSAS